MSFTSKLANVLNAKARKQISDENFALPGRKYPIENKAHARNALARVAQFGSPEEQSQVRAAVHKKYPAMKKGPEVSFRESLKQFAKRIGARAEGKKVRRNHFEVQQDARSDEAVKVSQRASIKRSKKRL